MIASKDFVTQRIRRLARPGDVLVSFHKRDWISRAIADVTKSSWSHAFLYIGNGKILESDIKTGVVIDDLERYLKYDKYFLGLRRPSPNPHTGRAMVEACKKYVGVEYGLWQLVYMGFLYAVGLRRDTRWTKTDFDGMICSELIAMGLMDIHHYPKAFGSRIPSDIEPGDLAEALEIIV